MKKQRNFHSPHPASRFLPRMKLLSFPAMVFVLFLALTTALPAEETKGQGEIVLGMSTALSGPAADLGKNMREGVLVGLERANQAGGIHGRLLKLIALDDGYEPTRTAPNMRKLIEQEEVLAVIGNVGTPTAIAAVPIANEQKTLLYAPFTGAGVLRKTPPDRYVINYRASYAEETAAMIDALIKIGKLNPKDIAFFTQRDGYGDAGFIGGIAALKRHGLGDEDSVMHARYERNTLAVENGLANIFMTFPPPRAIIMVGAYAPCAKFIRLAVESGLDALFLNVSFVGSAPLAREIGNFSPQVIVTQVVPHPEEETLPIVNDYRVDLAKLFPRATPTFGSLEGYIATRIFTRALGKIKGPPNRENVIDALESLGNFTIGLGHSLQLSKQEHQASRRVWPTILREGEFVPFHWKDIPTVLKRKT